MNVARRSDGLLSAKQTIALLGLIRSHPHGRPELQLLRDLAASYPAIWSKARNTVALLRDLNVVAETQGLLWINDPSVDSRSWTSFLGELTARSLVDRLARQGLGSCLQANSASGGLWLDSMLLPGAADGLPLWVIEFAVAMRERSDSRFWRVTATYESLFLEGARAANRRLVRKSISSAELEAKLAKDAVQGREAEEWVLAFEQRRLSRHPLIDQIRQISDENVAGGYDIASFSNTNVLHHDLFIEVKSYRGSKRFFWSRNEIATASLLGEDYSLYLVDHSRIHLTGYEPQIIRGPYTALIQSDASGWSISPTTFECVATS